MGHLKLYCDGCGSSWDVYTRDDMGSKLIRTCPICGKSIDPGIWNRRIIQAFGMMERANRDLVTNHTQTHGTLFTVSYFPDVIYPNRDRSEENLNDLREEISDLADKIEEMKERIY